MWWWWWWGGGEGGGGGDDNDGDDIMMLMRTMTLVIVMIVITMMIVDNSENSDDSGDDDDDDDDDDGMMGCISNKSGNIWSNTCSPTLITLMITTTILTTYVVTWWLFKTTTLMANHNISLIIYNHYFSSTSLPCLSLKCVVRTSAPQKFLQLQSQGLFQVRTRREWWLISLGLKMVEIPGIPERSKHQKWWLNTWFNHRWDDEIGMICEYWGAYHGSLWYARIDL